MNDERLRAAYETLLRERSTRTDVPDVSLESMCDVLARRGNEDARLAVIDRIMAHPRLAEEFEILRSAQEASKAAQRGLFSPRPLAIAASLLAVVSVGTWLAQRDGGNRETDRLRGARVAIPLYAPAETALADSARVFVWAGNPDANRYIFELNTADGNPLYAITTPDTSLVLPDSVRLAPGASYFWWIRSSAVSGEIASPLRPLVTRAR